ncbi:uncharacterized protein [Amphiura filiformis]|uniref:uncharacterized protein n=1 Tax=Amphiura filiformis TaxID=82378 RepID=UPI003B211467
MEVKLNHFTWLILLTIVLFPCNGTQVGPEDVCLTGVTQDIDGELTWPETEVGNLAFSNEKCSSDTSRAGWPLALRTCNVSENSPGEAEWSPVYVMGCSEDTGDAERDEGYCQEGWDPYGPYCYFIDVEHLMTFNDAVIACQNMSSNLTSIHSHGEQFYHMAIYRTTLQDLWIGLHDKPNENNFEWVDGTPLDFESWSPNQPDNFNSADDCVHLWAGGSGDWNDGPCDDLLGFICKKPKVAHDGYCSADMTVLEAGGTLTWPETPIGDTALSEETCGSNTDNNGRAVGVRVCTASVQECSTKEDKTLPKDTAILEQCPDDWHGYSGYCYYISDTSANFDDAQAACATNGSSLTSIHSVGEQVFLQGLTGSSAPFIGLNDREIEGRFVWLDGSRFGYSNWGEDQPNNWQQNQDCVQMFGGEKWSHTQGWWNDVPCNADMVFICKKQAICNFTLGMESGRIVDSQLSASSVWDPLHGPTRARLNQPREGHSRGAWTAGSSAQDQDQWIQVSFLQETVVTAVIIQGREDEDQWVTQYSVEYTRDGSAWNYINTLGFTDSEAS